MSYENDTRQSPNPLPISIRFLIFGIGFVTLLFAVGFVSGFATEPAERQSDISFDRTLLVYTVLLAAGCFALSRVCRQFVDHRPWKTMGFQKLRVTGRDGIMAGLCLGSVPILVTAGSLCLFGVWRMDGVRLSGITLAAVPALAAAAFAEEVVFRGYLLRNMLDDRRPVAGILLTSVFFLLAHGGNPGVRESPIISINIAGAGVLLGLAFLLTDSIWFAVAVHFGWNAAQGLLLNLPVSGMTFGGLIQISPADSAPTWLTGGSFGPEGSVLITACELVMIACFVTAVRRRSVAASQQSFNGVPKAGSDQHKSEKPSPATPR